MSAGEAAERFDGKIERIVLRTRTAAAGVVASALQGESKLRNLLMLGDCYRVLITVLISATAISFLKFFCSLEHAKKSFYRAVNAAFSKIGRVPPKRSLFS